MSELTKEEKIAAEYERLAAYFTDIDANKRAMLEPVIENCAFLRVAIEDAQEEINRAGVVEHYTNGEHQKGVKVSAAVQGYNGLVKSYNAFMRQLMDNVPREAKASNWNLLQDQQRKETPEEYRERLLKENEKIRERIRNDRERERAREKEQAS